MGLPELILTNKRPVTFDQIFGNNFAKRAVQSAFFVDESTLHSVDKRVKTCQSFLLFGVP